MRTPLIILILLLATSANAKSFGDYEGAIFVRNYDGDTITFDLPDFPDLVGDNIGIRVNGIDTAEIKGKCEKEKYSAQQAKVFAKDILQDAEQINLKNLERGKYFRIVADVIVDGDNLADLLIEAGLAVRYDGGKKNKNWCQ